MISTLFSKQLHGITKPADSLPTLAETHAVSIMVVNLWYPGRDLLAWNHGFGYLVPPTTPDNDECVLGVIFDSDLIVDPKHPKGTKLTVMLGGHLWDDWKHLPTEEAGIEMARAAVQKQLGIGAEEKVQAAAKLCRDCLPQHFVGHRERMAEAHGEILRAFRGRLSVAGPSYTNVGVIPAMRAGWEAALRVAYPGRADVWFRDGADNNPGTGIIAGWRAWWKERSQDAKNVGLSFAEVEDTYNGQQLWQLKPDVQVAGGGMVLGDERQEALLRIEATAKMRRRAWARPDLDRLQPHTGLEEFAVPELHTMFPIWKEDMYFRGDVNRWTISMQLKTRILLAESILSVSGGAGAGNARVSPETSKEVARAMACKVNPPQPADRPHFLHRRLLTQWQQQHQPPNT